MKTIAAITVALALLFSIGCGPSAEQKQQEKVASFAVHKIQDDLDKCKSAHKGWQSAREMDLQCFDTYSAEMREWSRLFPQQAHELEERIKQAERGAYEQKMKDGQK